MRREYERLRPTIEGFCGCDLCRDDVFVYVLNRVRPSYVTTPRGEVLTSVQLDTDQPHADVARVLMDAFRRVQAQPREGHPHQT